VDFIARVDTSPAQETNCKLPIVARRGLAFAPMNSGKAFQAGVRVILWSLAGLVAFFLAAWVGTVLGAIILAFWPVFTGLWLLAVIAVLFLIRDPDPIEPGDKNAVVAPAHGTVDVIDTLTENDFVKAPGQRVSIRISPFDVQVQYAPLIARVAHFDLQRPIKSGGSAVLETLVLGFEPVLRPEARMAVRLIGGTWGRRIVPWIAMNDIPQRSQRIGMMRLGARADVFLPAGMKLMVQPGERVIGGQSVLAKFE
jgi:phosphatidylserine decarboxylase